MGRLRVVWQIVHTFYTVLTGHLVEGNLVHFELPRWIIPLSSLSRGAWGWDNLHSRGRNTDRIFLFFKTLEWFLVSNLLAGWLSLVLKCILFLFEVDWRSNDFLRFERMLRALSCLSSYDIVFVPIFNFYLNRYLICINIYHIVLFTLTYIWCPLFGLLLRFLMWIPSWVKAKVALFIIVH